MNGVNLMNNTLKLMHWTAKHPVYTHTQYKDFQHDVISRRKKKQLVPHLVNKCSEHSTRYYA